MVEEERVYFYWHSCWEDVDNRKGTVVLFGYQIEPLMKQDPGAKRWKNVGQCALVIGDVKREVTVFPSKNNMAVYKRTREREGFHAAEKEFYDRTIEEVAQRTVNSISVAMASQKNKRYQNMGSLNGMPVSYKPDVTVTTRDISKRLSLPESDEVRRYLFMGEGDQRDKVLHTMMVSKEKHFAKLKDSCRFESCVIASWSFKMNMPAKIEVGDGLGGKCEVYGMSLGAKETLFLRHGIKGPGLLSFPSGSIHKFDNVSKTDGNVPDVVKSVHSKRILFTLNEEGLRNEVDLAVTENIIESNTMKRIRVAVLSARSAMEDGVERLIDISCTFYNTTHYMERKDESGMMDEEGEIFDYINDLVTEEGQEKWEKTVSKNVVYSTSKMFGFYNGGRRESPSDLRRYTSSVRVPEDLLTKGAVNCSESSSSSSSTPTSSNKKKRPNHVFADRKNIQRSRESMLAYFLKAFCEEDPDVVVGAWLDHFCWLIALEAKRAFGNNSWSSMGRIIMSKIPGEEHSPLLGGEGWGKKGKKSSLRTPSANEYLCGRVWIDMSNSKVCREQYKKGDTDLSEVVKRIYNNPSGAAYVVTETVEHFDPESPPTWYLNSNPDVDSEEEGGGGEGRTNKREIPEWALSAGVADYVTFEDFELDRVDILLDETLGLVVDDINEEDKAEEENKKKEEDDSSYPKEYSSPLIALLDKKLNNTRKRIMPYVEVINRMRREEELVVLLLRILCALPVAYEMCNTTGRPISEYFSGGKQKNCEYYLMHEFWSREYTIPERKAKFKIEGANRKKKFKGGYNLTPDRGLHRDSTVVLLDFVSMYPSIMKEFDVCFLTTRRIQKELEEREGIEFIDYSSPDHPGGLPHPKEKNRVGVLPSIVWGLIENRKKVKADIKALTEGIRSIEVILKEDKSLAVLDRRSHERSIENMKVRLSEAEIRQLVMKLTANIIYGTLGFAGTLFPGMDLARYITMRGRDCLSYAKYVAEERVAPKVEKEFGVKLSVTYGDTDSLFVKMSNSRDRTLGELVPNVVCNIISESFDYMRMGNEVNFDGMVIIAKKNYAAFKRGLEKGDGKERLDMKGLFPVKRDHSEVVSTAVRYFVLCFFDVVTQFQTPTKQDDNDDDKTQESDDLVFHSSVKDKLKEMAVYCANGIRRIGSDVKKYCHCFSMVRELSRHATEYESVHRRALDNTETGNEGDNNSSLTTQPQVEVARLLFQDGRCMAERGDRIPHVVCKGESPYYARCAHPADLLDNLDYEPEDGGLELDVDWYVVEEYLSEVSRFLDAAGFSDLSDELYEELTKDTAYAHTTAKRHGRIGSSNRKRKSSGADSVSGGDGKRKKPKQASEETSVVKVMPTDYQVSISLGGSSVIPMVRCDSCNRVQRVSGFEGRPSKLAPMMRGHSGCKTIEEAFSCIFCGSKRTVGPSIRTIRSVGLEYSRHMMERYSFEASASNGAAKDKKVNPFQSQDVILELELGDEEDEERWPVCQLVGQSENILSIEMMDHYTCDAIGCGRKVMVFPHIGRGAGEVSDGCSCERPGCVGKMKRWNVHTDVNDIETPVNTLTTMINLLTPPEDKGITTTTITSNNAIQLESLKGKMKDLVCASLDR